MDRKASNLTEARSHFDSGTEPVLCDKEGSDPQTVNTFEEAEAYFADEEAQEA